MTESNRKKSVLAQKLKQEIARRKLAEFALKKNKAEVGFLLSEADKTQTQLRSLIHRFLSRYEEERQSISRRIHDEIGQNLTGVNVRLATLKRKPSLASSLLKVELTRIQRLVETTIQQAQHYVRELRPTLLDDLGLVPALYSYVKSFGKKTGIPIRFTAFTLDKIKQLNSSSQTVLYRVAQEALMNVGKHAHASLVKVHIQKTKSTVRMVIKDNGCSFRVNDILSSTRCSHLGLIGMKERMHMIGGCLDIESVTGVGTTVCAQVPFNCKNIGAS
jgi:signal transduction histidine kinase